MNANEPPKKANPLSQILEQLEKKEKDIPIKPLLAIPAKILVNKSRRSITLICKENGISRKKYKKLLRISRSSLYETST